MEGVSSFFFSFVYLSGIQGQWLGFWSEDKLCFSSLFDTGMAILARLHHHHFPFGFLLFSAFGFRHLLFCDLQERESFGQIVTPLFEERRRRRRDKKEI